MASQFSKDGKYFAQISNDGKLKIWNTITNTFEQEYTPDFHLTSPCTCLQFVEECRSTSKIGSPKKKKRKDSNPGNTAPSILLGTTNGYLLNYSISNAKVQSNDDTSANVPINCLSVDDENVYIGADTNILEWCWNKKKLLSKWSSGNEKINSILAVPDRRVLTASKQITLWDVASKEKLCVYTGHSSSVCYLYYIKPKGHDNYFISGSTGDRILNCWNLNDQSNTKEAVAKFLMEDIVINISTFIGNDGSTQLGATVRSGVVHVYQHTLNGKSNKKPLKPKTTIQVVDDNEKDRVTPIYISGSIFRDEQTVCIGYGNAIAKTFENITISNFKKVHCLLRKDPQTISVVKEQEKSKIVKPLVDNDVHYLTPHVNTTSSTTVKRKNDGQLEVPMERRLENLSLNILDGNSKLPKSDNMAQLLLQGLHSNDKNILRTVLCKRDEQIIKNTIKRLPVPVIIPLIHELTSLIQGKTLSAQIGALWMKQLLMVNAGVLVSNPELSELFCGTLGTIETRLSLQTPLTRLKGRLDLLMEQVKAAPSQDINVEEDEAMLVYNDKSDLDDEEDMDNDENELMKNDQNGDNNSTDSEEWMMEEDES